MDNPWSLGNIARIKEEYDANQDGTRQKYPDLFYYFDGLLDVKISQSVHPAGMVISPITLDDNYGVFYKDGDLCLILDMENIHDYTGLVKYDFLVLKTVEVIRDTCRYLGEKYPKSHEINWCDSDVWKDMLKSPCGIFQFEGAYAFESLKKFNTSSIFDMSIVTACIRPSGASYRDKLLARVPHKNPSEIIDELLKDNFGYLIYQEDTIKFLQQICGLSGSESDNIRRAIGRKQRERLDAAMPFILEGYCSKSNSDRNKAEQEAKEFLQILEDSASYQFGYNHSIAYCMLGYLCAYYRYYNPIEFITSFLNNAANDDDIKSGTKYANTIGISVTMPKWGLSRDEYFFDKSKNVIAKGLSSVREMNSQVANELYEVASSSNHKYFVDVLKDIFERTSIRTNQLDILIKIDFFSDFGNQRTLTEIKNLFIDVFKKGAAKQISKEAYEGMYLNDIIKKYSSSVTKSGAQAKKYTILDMNSLLEDIEKHIRGEYLEDFSDVEKVRNFKNAMGYAGYVSGKQEDRPKLYIIDIFPIFRKKDRKKFGYSFVTKSIGSGVETRFSVRCHTYERCRVQKEDIIYCKGWQRDGKYFIMTDYEKIE